MQPSALPRLVCALLTGISALPAFAAEALRLHPDNPRYFLFRGQPTVLITSAEHYGAVLNADFNFQKYLAALNAAGLNNTRVFTGGAYVEPAGAFNITRNTLAPAAGRFLAPWLRSPTPGYAGGGNRFDLDRWDDAYFKRFREFMTEASRQGVVVEVNLFCPFYEEIQWRLSPFHADNNVNGAGRDVARTNVYTLDRHGGLLPIQERLVRKFVEELKDFDNLYYEICNEPYFGGVTIPWQHHIADVITAAQQAHAQPKLISQNIANGTERVTQPHPHISVLNFHYAAPPTAVAENFQLKRVIGDNETGFRGTNDAPYRMEAWDFLIAGGGLFNHLDYSFAVGFEDGTFTYPATQPGGGNPDFRCQLGYLRDFIRRCDFVGMHPDDAVLEGSTLPHGATARALVKPGEQYAVYVRTAQLPQQYSARWTGSLTVSTSGEYTFYTVSNDGVRLWLDDKSLIDNWTEHSTTEDKATVRLEAGRTYPLKLEYFYAGGQAVMKLLWSGPEIARQLVPASALKTAEGQRGLRGEYFADKTLSARARDTVDLAINLESPEGKAGQVRFSDGELVVRLAVSAGKFQAEWLDTKTGTNARKEEFEGTGRRELRAPAFEDDIALRVTRR